MFSKENHLLGLLPDNWAETPSVRFLAASNWLILESKSFPKFFSFSSEKFKSLERISKFST